MTVFSAEVISQIFNNVLIYFCLDRTVDYLMSTFVYKCATFIPEAGITDAG